MVRLTTICMMLLAVTANYARAQTPAAPSTIDWFEGRKHQRVPAPEFTPNYESFQGERLSSLRDTLRDGLRVLGRGRIVKNQPDAAESEARANAASFAVETLLRNLLKDDVVHTRWPEIAKVFLSVPDEFLRTVSKQEEKREGGNLVVTYGVTFNAEKVLLTAMHEDWPLREGLLPSVLVALPMKPVDGSFPQHLPKVANTLEESIEHSLYKSGFTVVPRKKMFRSVPEGDEDLFLFAEDDKAAELARRTGADILLRGSCVVTSGEAPEYLKKSGMAAIQAEVTLHPVRTADGAALGTVQRHESAVNITLETGTVRAANDAFGALRPRFTQELILRWLLDENSLSTFRLSLEMVPTRMALLGLIAAIEKLPEVRSAARMGFDAGVAVLEITYTGDRAKILKALETQRLCSITGEEAVLVSGTFTGTEPALTPSK